MLLVLALDGGECWFSRPRRFAPRYRLDRRLGGPQSRSGRRRDKNSWPYQYLTRSKWNICGLITQAVTWFAVSWVAEVWFPAEPRIFFLTTALRLILEHLIQWELGALLPWMSDGRFKLTRLYLVCELRMSGALPPNSYFFVVPYIITASVSYINMRSFSQP
jgi:hypothetical protein